MTPEQKAALEAVAERAISAEEEAALDAFLPDRMDVQIAELLSIGRTKLVETLVDEGKILTTIGLDAGNALLDAIDANTDFRHAKRQLTNRGLDVSQLLVRTAIDAMVYTVDGFEQTHADAIKNLAEAAHPVSVADVSKALNEVENG